MTARDEHETQTDYSSTKQASPSNGVSTHDFQPLVSRPTNVRNNSGGLVVQHEVRYLALHPHLPPSAPHSHPHIIDYPTVSYTWPQTGLGLADLVVTVLYKYDPHVLDLFLYSGKRKFEFRRKGPNKLTAVPFIIRDMKFVTVCLPFFPVSLLSIPSSFLCPSLPLLHVPFNGHLTSPFHPTLITSTSKVGTHPPSTPKQLNESITYRIIDGATGPWAPMMIRGEKSSTMHGAKALDAYVRGECAKDLLAQRIWMGGEEVKFEVVCK